jgi:hypothetical protein
VLETGTLDQAVTDVRFDSDKGWVRVTFTNLGELVMPAAYRVTYEGGSTELRKLPVEAWSTTRQWTAAWDSQGKPIVRVELDPDGRLPDVNRANNTWQKPAPAGGTAPAGSKAVSVQ